MRPLLKLFARPAQVETEFVGFVVLLVDADASAVQQLSLQLGAHPDDVHHVACASEALYVCNAHPPNLIFIGLDVPGLDASALANALKQQVGGGAVLIAVASVDCEKPSNFDLVLTRPLNLLDFNQSELLNRWR